jgi:ADP-L-glycero-D-manno-heptose 6-epimerase
MIVITGGGGFIGKNLAYELIKRGYMGIMILDTKNEDLDSIYSWLVTHASEISVIFHLGAITDTTIMDRNLFDEYNVNASVFIWNLCCTQGIPLIYASSAATYGDGNEGFDDEKSIHNLKPLNPYGESKQQFDLFALGQEKKDSPPNWYGLKFFNVYGYGEANKGKMASTILQFYNQVTTDNFVRLFKSHRSDYNDGEQLRDFIYIDDILDVCIFMAEEKPLSGIYNVGTGKARTFNDVAKAVFKSLETSGNILYIDTPIKIRDKYQYFTEAKIQKLRMAGYKKPFHELEEGVLKYVNKLKYEIR